MRTAGSRWCLSRAVQVDDELRVREALTDLVTRSFQEELARGNVIPGGCQHGEQMSGQLVRTLDELQTVKRKHAAFRKRMGWPGPGSADTWVIAHLAGNGARRAALAHALRSLRSPRPFFRSVAKLGRALVGARRPSRPYRLPPDVQQAVREVEAILRAEG